MSCISLTTGCGVEIWRAFIEPAPPYGKSTFFFLVPSITSIDGRAGAGGAVMGRSAAGADVCTMRGLGRRVVVVLGLSSFGPRPGSGTGSALSPASNEVLLAPGVV